MSYSLSVLKYAFGNGIRLRSFIDTSTVGNCLMYKCKLCMSYPCCCGGKLSFKEEKRGMFIIEVGKFYEDYNGNKIKIVYDKDNLPDSPKYDFPFIGISVKYGTMGFYDKTGKNSDPKCVSIIRPWQELNEVENRDQQERRAETGQALWAALDKRVDAEINELHRRIDSDNKCNTECTTDLRNLINGIFGRLSDLEAPDEVMGEMGAQLSYHKKEIEFTKVKLDKVLERLADLECRFVMYTNAIKQVVKDSDI